MNGDSALELIVQLSNRSVHFYAALYGRVTLLIKTYTLPLSQAAMCHVRCW